MALQLEDLESWNLAVGDSLKLHLWHPNWSLMQMTSHTNFASLANQMVCMELVRGLSEVGPFASRLSFLFLLVKWCQTQAFYLACSEALP
jgi:hypothetical protein